MEVFHAARPAQKPGGAPGSRSHPAWPLQVWVLETVAILARQGAGQKLECWARLEVEGGSAQKGDDITTQPLKMSCSRCHFSSAPEAPGRTGDLEQPRWTREPRGCPRSCSRQGGCWAGAGQADPAQRPCLQLLHPTAALYRGQRSWLDEQLEQCMPFSQKKL